MARKTLEWHVCKAGAETEWARLTGQLADQDTSSTPPGATLESPKTRYLYELICGIALLCGVVVYLLWQQAAQRIAATEHEIAALHDEIAAFQQSGVEPEQAAAYESSSSPWQFETDYLHFEASPATIAVVQRIASRVDAKFQQLQREFGLTLPSSTEKLRVIVDSVTNEHYPFSNEQQIVVDHPKFAAKRYGISEADALMTELLARLAMKLIDKAIDSREIKTQWRGMTLALKTIVQMDQGYNPNWQWTDMHLFHRYNAQRHSLDLVHNVRRLNDPELPGEPWLQVSPIAHAAASPLVEFTLATYGYEKIPALLDAFAAYDSWETLAPALFHLSAAEFQEQWHAYLRQHYPIPG